MHYIVRMSLFGIALTVSAHAFGAELPNTLKEALSSAHATGNEFVLSATLAQAKTMQPQLSGTIDAYIQSLIPCNLSFLVPLMPIFNR